MFLYQNGVPCRSTLLPEAVRQLIPVAQRSSETLTAYCWEACPTVPTLTHITDDYGNVVEVVKSGEGYVSLADGEPTLPPAVKRQTIYYEEGRQLKLQCPQ